MPSRGRDRQEWAKQTVQCFAEQNYSNKILLIIDDQDDPCFPNPHDVKVTDVHFIGCPTRLSIGTKRNIGGEWAKQVGATYIAHYDTDDWSAPTRISEQIALLETSGKSLCGLDSLIFYDPQVKRAGLWADAGNCCGTSMVYRVDWWEKHRFPEVTKLNGQVVAWGEDNAFRNMAQDAQQYVALRSHSLMVARAHKGNTNEKHMGGFKPFDVKDLPEGFPR